MGSFLRKEYSSGENEKLFWKKLENRSFINRKGSAAAEATEHTRLNDGASNGGDGKGPEK